MQKNKYISIKYSRKGWSINLITFATILFILSPIISTQEVGNPSFLYVCFIFSLASISYFIENQKIIFNNYHFYAFLFLLSAVISTIINGTINELTIIETAKYFIFTIFYILTTGAISIYSASKFRTIFRTYISVSTLLAILVILSSIFGFYHADSENFISRTSIGITGLYKNPNYIESFIVLGYYLLIYRIVFYKTSPYHKFIFGIIISLMFISSYLSGTRAALLMFIICPILILLYWAKKYNKLFRTSIILLIIPVIIYFIYSEEIQNLYLLFTRNRDFLSDEGRIKTWSYILQNLISHPFLGLGLMSDNFLVENTGIGYLESIHNVFLELITNQGLIGFTIFNFIIFSNYSRTKRYDRGFILMFLLISGFPMFFQNGFVAVNFWKFLLLNRLIIGYSIKNDKGIKGLLSHI